MEHHPHIKSDSIPEIVRKFRAENIGLISKDKFEIVEKDGDLYFQPRNGENQLKLRVNFNFGHIKMAYVDLNTGPDNNKNEYTTESKVFIVFSENMKSFYLTDSRFETYKFEHQNVSYIKTSEGIFSWKRDQGLCFRSYAEIFALADEKFKNTFLNTEGKDISTYRALEIIVEGNVFYLFSEYPPIKVKLDVTSAKE